MKVFKLVPVAFRQYMDNNDCWYVSEIETEKKQYNPETKKMDREFGGTGEVERYLNSGWSIVSIQTAPIPASDSVPGAMITQYLLSIDVPN